MQLILDGRPRRPEGYRVRLLDLKALSAFEYRLLLKVKSNARYFLLLKVT